MMTWESLVAEYHKKHTNEISILSKTEAYIQSIVLKKTYISFDRRRGIEEGDGHNEVDVPKIIEI